MVGRSFVQDFGSKVMGLLDALRMKRISVVGYIKKIGICPTYAYHLGLSDLDNKINMKSCELFAPKGIKNVYAIFSR